MQKACGHPARKQDSHSLRAHDLRFYFTPRTGVLFTFPSRYWFTIGHRRVFSLGGWSPQIQTEFHVFRPTRDTRGASSAFVYGTVTLCGAAFQQLPLASNVPVCGSHDPPPQAAGFRLFRVRSPLLAESRLISLPPGTEMFHFPGSGFPPLCIQNGMILHDQDRVAPFGNPRIIACVPLPEAYRSLPRPSSPVGAKASIMRPT